MNISTRAANTIWFASCLLEAQAFWRATRDVAATQERLLLQTLHRNAESAFGRAHGFGSIRSVEAYQRQVPLASYDDYRPLVERIGAGEGGVLTTEPVTLLEPTSGSTAARKLIPYTATLKAEFGRGIAPWIADLFRHDPRLFAGSAYWSITPVAQRDEHTVGGIPIGFEDDGAYLGRVQQAMQQAVMAVPPAIRFVTEIETFRYLTLLFLLRRRDLALVSVWNPTFWTLLLGCLPSWWPRLATNIAEGTLTPPQPLAPDLHRQFVARNRPDPRRGAQIAAAFANDDLATATARLWPGMRLLSCWADANAARLVPEAARLLPQARLQGKGLIATEGFVSLPLWGHTGAALAIRSHFFEFIPANGGAIKLSHQIERGEMYEVIISTGGGLYRYQLHDLVEVVGFVGGCPLLRFRGKSAHVSDWFGEKLNERHVRQALDELLARYGIVPAFAMLACDEYAPNQYAYTLFIEANCLTSPVLRALQDALEEALQANYHYRYCRDLGQLDHLRICPIARNGWEMYLTTCQSHGQRLGDIKPVALHSGGGWGRAFSIREGFKQE